MLLIRLLPISLVLITNTWLLKSVRSDALSRYKHSLALRADRELSRLAGEPCTVSGVFLSRLQLRSVSAVQHRPPAAHSRTATSRTAPRSIRSAPAVCTGECKFHTGARRVAPSGNDKGGWGNSGDVALRAGGRHAKLLGQFYEKNYNNHERDSNYVGIDATKQPGMLVPKDTRHSVSEGHTRSSRDSRSRFARSLDVKPRNVDEDNTRWRKVSPDSSTDSRGLQAPHALQQGDADNQSPTMTPKNLAEDYSGEVEEPDAPASLPVDSWGSPVPRVPPSWMTALYFNGRREQLKVKLSDGEELPRARFSLELWVKPEGGQSNPAVIAGGCKLVITAS